MRGQRGTGHLALEELVLAGGRVEVPERAVAVQAEHEVLRPVAGADQAQGAVGTRVLEIGVDPPGGADRAVGGVELPDLIVGLVVEAAVLSGFAIGVVQADEAVDRALTGPLGVRGVPEQGVGPAGEAGGEGHRDQVPDLLEPVESGDLLVASGQVHVGDRTGVQVDGDEVCTLHTGADVGRSVVHGEAFGVAVAVPGLEDRAVVPFLPGLRVVGEHVSVRVGRAVQQPVITQLELAHQSAAGRVLQGFGDLVGLGVPVVDDRPAAVP